MKFTFGSDPEFIVTNQMDVPVSAIGIVPGDRKNRHKYKGHEYYYDNVMAECAIKPGSNLGEVLTNFKECFQYYGQLVKPHLLQTWAFEQYPEQELRHKDARKAGCKEEYCAYAIRQVPPPQMEIKYEPDRSAGGHVHIGAEGHVHYEIDSEDSVSLVGRWDVAKVLDLFLGVPSLYMDDEPGAINRKELYGQAGRYRATPYGIEYRTLGNFWLKHPILVQTVYILAKAAIEFVNEKKNRDWLWNFDEEQLYVYAPECYTYKYPVEGVRQAIGSHDCKSKAAFWVMKYVVQPRIHPQLYKDIMKFKLRSSLFDFYEGWQID